MSMLRATVQGWSNQVLENVRLDPMNVTQILDLASEAWAGRGRETLMFQNLHTLFVQSEEPALSEALRESTVLVDGMSIVWLLRLAGQPVSAENRVTALDMIWPILRLADSSNKRVYIFGQTDDVNSAAVAAVRRERPRLDVMGRGGFFDDGDSAEIIEEMNQFKADLVLVGLGTPKTELWLHANRERIDAPVAWSCGGLMEYVSGEMPTPPRWAGPLGVEWLFRFISDPKRFWIRYIVEPPRVLARYARQLIGTSRSSH